MDASETEIWRAHKQAVKQDRQEAAPKRIASSLESFEVARELASQNGLVLKKVDENLYHLSHAAGGWLLNLYPSNQRIYRDKNKAQAPFLNMQREWNVLDVVKAAMGENK